MTFEQALRDYVLSLAPVTALVGTRVFMLALPQNEKRASVRMQPVSASADQHLRGPSGIRTSRVQFDAYTTLETSADPFADAAAVGAAVHGDGLGAEASGVFGMVADLGGSPALFHVHNARLALTRGPFFEYADEKTYVRFQRDYLIDWKAL